MGDKIDEIIKKKKEEREKLLKPLKEANALIDKARKAAKAKDKDNLADILEKIFQKKMEFCDLMPPIYGYPFGDWYTDLKGWDASKTAILHWLIDYPNPDWKKIDEMVDGFGDGKHRIEGDRKSTRLNSSH